MRVMFMCGLMVMIGFVGGVTQALAEKKQKIERITATDDDQDQQATFTAPAPGEELVVVVDVPWVQRLRARAGFTVASTMPARPQPCYTAGGTGELGVATKRLRGTFRAGYCRGATEIIGGLAMVLGRDGKGWYGLSADVLYHSDTAHHPGESAVERIVGASLVGDFDLPRRLWGGTFRVGGQLGLGGATHQIPGGHPTDLVIYGGLTAAYTWGN